MKKIFCTLLLIFQGWFNSYCQSNIGLDFSHHYSNINWKEISLNKPEFIIHKATEGSTFTDYKYLERKRLAAENNIPFGAYHYFSFKSSGSKQAQHFINVSKLKSGDIIPVLDIEISKYMPKEEIWIIEVENYITTIKNQLKVLPIIYCEEVFFNTYLKNKFPEIKFWIANYENIPSCNYILWQYSKTGKKYKMNSLDLNKIHPNYTISDILIK